MDIQSLTKGIQSICFCYFMENRASNLLEWISLDLDGCGICLKLRKILILYIIVEKTSSQNFHVDINFYCDYILKQSVIYFYTQNCRNYALRFLVQMYKPEINYRI